MTSAATPSTSSKRHPLLYVGFGLVLAMALLQAYFAVSAYVDPQSFAASRGTTLTTAEDADWVRIYASRTLFIALLLGYLLWRCQFTVLKWAALLGTVMPVTDAVLAYQAGATSGVIARHVATLIYLLVTFAVLHVLQRKSSQPADEGAIKVGLN
jgi:hypothetical protein